MSGFFLLPQLWNLEFLNWNFFFMGVPFGRAIRYIFFVAEKATKKDTAPIPNAEE
jgi:hypothetical protein